MKVEIKARWVRENLERQRIAGDTQIRKRSASEETTGCNLLAGEVHNNSTIRTGFAIVKVGKDWIKASNCGVNANHFASVFKRDSRETRRTTLSLERGDFLGRDNFGTELLKDLTTNGTVEEGGGVTRDVGIHVKQILQSARSINVSSWNQA